MNHLVQVNRVLAVIPYGLKTAERYIKIAKGRGVYIDASRGRNIRSVLLMDDGTVVTSALNVMTVLKRFSVDQEDFTPDYQDSDAEDMLEFNDEDEV
jgi:regulator of extracellular matrix RemA (YlzA/DUF370 family)